MRNKFSGVCVCGANVIAGAGTVSRMRGKWVVLCASHTGISLQARDELHALRIQESDKKAQEAHAALGALFKTFEEDGKARRKKAVSRLPWSGWIAYQATSVLWFIGLALCFVLPRLLGIVPLMLCVIPAEYLQSAIASRYGSPEVVRKLG